MKCLKLYKNQKKAKAYRYRQRKSNYEKGKFGIPGTKRRYTPNEDWEVLFSEMTDRQIAEELKRNVNAIQERRWKILQGKVKSAYSLY